MPSIYLSPSTQEYNMYYDNSGSEEYYMNRIADAMIPYLDATGISYTRNDPNKTVSNSIAQSNAGTYDLHLALHSNAAPPALAGMLRGADFYYYTKSTRGKRAATTLADNYMSIYPNPSQVKIMPTTALAEVTRTKAPAVLAELIYHDNEADVAWLKSNINAIARNLVQGLAEYFGIDFAEPKAAGNLGAAGVVATEQSPLNIRDRPSMSSNVIAQAPKGSSVTVYCTTGLWYVVEYNGKLGFAYAEYISLV